MSMKDIFSKQWVKVAKQADRWWVCSDPSAEKQDRDRIAKNCDRLAEQLSKAIEQQKAHDEAEMRQEKRRLTQAEKIATTPRYRDKEAGPPRKGWEWCDRD